MQIRRFELWLANLNPQKGTEPEKVRPVLVVQTNLLNELPHGSTIICPLSTNLIDDVEFLRVRLKSDQIADLDHDSDILLDQLRSIDNSRLIKKIGPIPDHLRHAIEKGLKIILDLEEEIKF